MNQKYTTEDAQKYQAVREAIFKVCPELLKLEFGCEYINRKHKYRAVITGKSNQYHIEVKGRQSVENIESVDDEKLTRILGKEPTIAEVLRALTCLRVPNIELSVCGMPKAAGLLIETKKQKALWELSKDKLSDQSPECIDFLYEILCGSLTNTNQ